MENYDNAPESESGTVKVGRGKKVKPPPVVDELDNDEEEDDDEEQGSDNDDEEEEEKKKDTLAQIDDNEDMDEDEDEGSSVLTANMASRKPDKKRTERAILGGLSPVQIESMTADTKDLLETQRILLDTVKNLAPVVTQGREMLESFKGTFGEGGGMMNLFGGSMGSAVASKSSPKGKK